MLLLAASNTDVASKNIRERILSHYHFVKSSENFEGSPVYETYANHRTVKLVTLSEELARAQNLPGSFADLELIVFISRHSSLSGTPTLSVHTPGNLGEGELGGLPRIVSISPANTVRDVLKAMVKFKEELALDYMVSYECTHHGPSLETPAMFAELGSSIEQWKDQKAAEVVAHATMQALEEFGETKASAVLGVGGPHYSAKFTRIALQEETAFGHIIPKYALEYVDMGILEQCVRRTVEKVESAVLDWKGIRSEYKHSLVDMLQSVGLSCRKA